MNIFIKVCSEKHNLILFKCQLYIKLDNEMNRRSKFVGCYVFKNVETGLFVMIRRLMN